MNYAQQTKHKEQATNHKQSSMVQKQKKPYDLEERTLGFAKDVIVLCKSIPQNAVTLKLIGQLVASSGSVGANYREATEALSKKDFLHRMKITRKECKESTYWLELINEAVRGRENEIKALREESRELRNIFTAIIEKAVQKSINKLQATNKLQ
jgi:four helix bundle protein